MKFKKNKLARLLENRKPALGVWMTLTDPGIAVILSRTGFDWIMIDTEHNPFTEAHLVSIVYALRDSEVTPIFRIRNNDAALAKCALDIGAQGVIIPMIKDVEDARRAVDFAKYPPLGNHGYGALRATDFWHDKNEYDENPNQAVLLICQIERVSAVEGINEILQIPGIDGIYIGPVDLSHSMGCKGDMQHPEVLKNIERVIEAANRYNKPWGMPVPGVEEYMRRVQQGALLATVGSDNRFMKTSATMMIEDCFKRLSKEGLRKQD